ncbi:chemotaxis protein CheW [Halioxenophilus aromaticivorans]|uniref:Chemotaxis protein CheW n=1 Tax=Halioxenophilus aromaticivorans TaxID=1306992 RepID=A0AAV3U0A0_9ALTE
MSDLTTTDQEALDTLPCLLLPMADQNLLLPTVSVAEMIPYSLPSRGSRGPDWYQGEVHWRNTLIPLVCYEMINGGSYPGVASRSRIGILNTTGVSDDLPYIAILTQGIPRLAQVENAHVHEVEGVETKAYDLMHVAMAAEEAIIPDLAALERAFLELDMD